MNCSLPEIPELQRRAHRPIWLFIFENGEQVDAHEHRIAFRPITTSELRERLEIAGLRDVDADFDVSRERYSVVTVTT